MTGKQWLSLIHWGLIQAKGRFASSKARSLVNFPKQYTTPNCDGKKRAEVKWLFHSILFSSPLQWTTSIIPALWGSWANPRRGKHYQQNLGSKLMIQWLNSVVFETMLIWNTLSFELQCVSLKIYLSRKLPQCQCKLCSKPKIKSHSSVIQMS